MDFVNRREMSQGLGEFGIDAQSTLGELTSGVSQDFYSEDKGMWVYWDFEDSVWIDSVHNDAYDADEIDLPIPVQNLSEINMNPIPTSSNSSGSGSGFTKGLPSNRNMIIGLTAAVAFLFFKKKGKK